MVSVAPVKTRHSLQDLGKYFTILIGNETKTTTTYVFPFEVPPVESCHQPRVGRREREGGADNLSCTLVMFVLPIHIA